MRKQSISFLIIFFAFTLACLAQTPQGMYYQAVVRDNTGNLVQNRPVSFRFTILSGTPTGTIVYQQTDTIVTDQMGLITVVVGGGGSIIQGNFATINWSVGNKYMKTELDINGGTAYTDMGTTQMLSVPYALYSGAAGNADTNWTKSGQNIYNTNPGNVGINNPNPAKTLDVNGPTKLGPNSPGVEMKEVDDTVTGVAGGTNVINTGIPDSSILSISVQVLDPINGLVAPFNSLTGDQYSYTFLSSVFTLTTSLTNSLAILSRPYKMLMIYKK